MGRCNSIRSISLGLLILLVQVLVAGQSVADWKVYVAPGLGISSASVETDGLVSGLCRSLWLETTMTPLLSIYKPVQYTFSLGRQPALRRWLEPASFYLGAGVGFAAIDIDATSNVIDAKKDGLDFAWNAGMGFNYALTKNVGVSVGYRYVGIGTQKVTAVGPRQPSDHSNTTLSFTSFASAFGFASSNSSAPGDESRSRFDAARFLATRSRLG